MNIYHRLMSHFYPKFTEQFTQSISKLTSKLALNIAVRSINFESTLKFRPISNQKAVHFLLSSNCELYEVTYLGLPIKFKTKTVKFYNNQQLVILDLPIKPSGTVDISVTFKYYCSQSDYLSFKKDNIMLNNKGGLFPHSPNTKNYDCFIHLTIPQGWHIFSGLKEISKNIKFDGQHLVLKGGSTDFISMVMASSLKTSDNVDDLTINVLYPRAYLNQVRTIVKLSKQLLTYYSNQYGRITNNSLNIAIVNGDFEKYFDGSNVVFSSSWLETIKENGKSPKDRERLIFSDLSKLISEFFWTDLVIKNPDESWLKEGISEYTSLLALKRLYGDEFFVEKISELQYRYVNSVGYSQGLSLVNASYGLGKNTDLCSPLNVLLIHCLSFLTEDRIDELLVYIRGQKSVEWKDFISIIKDKFSIDLNWLTENYVTRHKKANASLSRLELEGSYLKGSLVDPQKVWKGPVELTLVAEEGKLNCRWDGLSPIPVTERLVEVVLDPNSYIPGNVSGKLYPLKDNIASQEEKVGS